MLDFNNNIKNIDGWLTKEEGEFLYEMARKVPENGNIVEIGSWKGRSTICLGSGSRDGSGVTVHAIDPHTGSSDTRLKFGKLDTYNEFLSNIESVGIGKYVVPLKKTSQEVARRFNHPVSFIFVDGDHAYSSVKADHKSWFPKLVTGGVIAYHDCWNKVGVQLFTALVLLTSSQVRSPRLLDTLTIMEKTENNSFIDRIYNLFFVFYRLFVGWTGKIKLAYGGTVE